MSNVKKQENPAEGLNDEITDREVGIVMRLLNYKMPKIEAGHKCKTGNGYFSDKGWMFAHQICDDSKIDLPHRSTYLKMLRKRGLIERARVIVKDERGRASKQGLYVYRLKREKAYLIFCLLYSNDKIWEALNSDYLNETVLKQERYLLAHSALLDEFYDKREREVEKLRKKKKHVPMPFSLGEDKTYKKIDEEMEKRELLISPTKVYLTYVGKKFPKITHGVENELSCLTYDFVMCPDPVFKQKIYDAIKRLRPVVKHAIENRGYEEG